MLAESLAPRPIHGLSALFAVFDRYQERIPLDVLSSSLARLDFSRDDLSGFSIFDSECYCRNLLSSGPAYEALLICWRPGQCSPIHDHIGSSCAFRVLQGECSEIVYEPTALPEREAANSRTPSEDRRVVQIGRSTEQEGFVCATQDEDIHEVANLGNQNLQTLHVYSPPLRAMGTYVADGVTAPGAVPKGAFAATAV